MPGPLTRAERLFLALAGKLRRGSLLLSLPSGHRRLIEGSEPGPAADLAIRDGAFFRQLFSGGANGFAEAYMEGLCDSSDLPAFLKLVAANQELLQRDLEGRWWPRLAQRLLHLLRPNSRSGAKRNIRAHYDLGNDFYRTWLDASMTYSSAIYERREMSLEEAQLAKYRALAHTARIEPGQSLLEIGCGWGGFASWAARELDCRVTAVTISQAQHELAARRLQSEGLNERVRLLLQDYRDIRGSFDRIASIEMFEAVGEAYWPQFFAALRNNLKPGGHAGLQVITIADNLFERYRRSVDFIQRYVFPGGMLPSAAVLREQVERAGLMWEDGKGYARHYAETLAEWHRRFDDAWPQIREQGFDERFRRLWKYYLAYCEAGFSNGRIDVLQVGVARP
jgi:cyclopropane-fatty-acyl-phospholipid synthase